MEHLPPWLRDQPLPPRPASRRAAEDLVPDWLQGVEPAAPPAAAAPDWLGHAADAAPASASEADEETPDWLRSLQSEFAEPDAGASSSPADAGSWLLSDASTEPQPPSSVPGWLQGSDAADDDASIPDWLRSPEPAPPSAAPATPQSPLPSAAADDDDSSIPDWLRSPEPAPPASPQRPIPSGATSWLSNLGSETPDETPGAPPPVPPTPPAATPSSRIRLPVGATDWLRSMGEETEADQPADTADAAGESTAARPDKEQPREEFSTPDWLRDISPDDLDRDLAATGGADIDETFSPGSAELFDSEAPAWLTSPEVDLPASGLSTPSWLVGETASADDDALEMTDMPAWLRGVSGDEDETKSREEQAPLEPAADHATTLPPVETMPSWLVSAAEEATLTDAGDVPAWLRDTPREETAPTDAEDVPAWLRDAPREEAAPTGEGDVPAWLQDTPREEAAPTGEGDVPAWLRDTPREEAAPTGEGDVPAWLRDTPEEPPRVSTSSNDLPEWLRGASSEAQPEREAPARADLPEWLQGTPSEPALPGAAPSDLPAWLRGGDEPSSTAAPSPELPAWLRDDQDASLATPSAGEAALPTWLQGVSSEPPPAPPVLEGSGASEPAFAAFDWSEQPAPEEGNDFFGGADLPHWLRLPELERPAEAQDMRSLDWLSRIGVHEEETDSAAVATLAPVIMPVRPTFMRSQAQIESANLLQRLIATPIPASLPEARPSTVRRRQRSGLDRVLYALLVLALLAGLFLPQLGTVFQTTTPTSPKAQSLVASIDGLSENNVVLLAYEWDAQRSSELRPLEQAVTQHLIEKRAKMVLVSTDPQGTMLSFDLIDPLRAAGYNVDTVTGRDVGGRDYVLLGYRPGGELALRAMAQDLRSVLTSDFAGRDATVGALATRFDGTPRVQTLNDLSLIVVMADQPQDVQTWMEQIHNSAPTVPIAFLLPAETEPMVWPYLRKEGVFYLTGRQGALDYRIYRGDAGAGPEAASLSGQQFFAVAAFILLVLVGALVGALLPRKPHG